MLVKRVRVKDLKPDPNQPRKQFDDAELRRLGESLKKRQLMPLIIRRDGTLVDGERRFRAALALGLDELDAVFVGDDVTPEQVTEIQLESSLHRADLSPIEQYGGFMSWLQRRPGSTAKDLCDAIKRDPGSVSKILSLSRCVPEVHAAAKAGTIGPSHWWAISKADDPSEQIRLLSLHLNGATRDGLEAERKKMVPPAPAESVRQSRVRIPLPEAKSVVITSDAPISMGGVAKLLAELAKDAAKAAVTYDVSTWSKMMGDVAKKAATS